MVNISGILPIADGSATSNLCLASVMSNNFSQIATAINSSRLNSENYGISQVMSQHISASGMSSYHVSDSQFRSQHFSGVVFRESHVNYQSSAGGARFLRIGPTNDSLPANGIAIVRYSKTILVATTNATFVITWTFPLYQEGVAQHAFATVPWPVGMPYVQVSSTNAQWGYGPRRADILGLGSQLCTIQFATFASQSQTRNVTLHAVFAGPANG